MTDASNIVTTESALARAPTDSAWEMPALTHSVAVLAAWLHLLVCLRCGFRKGT